MSSYIFHEQIDNEMLNNLLNCNNLPVSLDKKYKSVASQLVEMSKRKQSTKGFPVKYRQRNNYGRLYADGPSLQTIQKDVKKKLIENLTVKNVDVDIVNCQAVLLHQDLQKRGIVIPFLDEYCGNRDNTISKYNLVNKEGIYRIMFNETCFSTNPDILAFHNRLYKTYFRIIAQENMEIFKSLIPTIKKKNKKYGNNDTYNINGSLMAYYLQNTENTVLTHIIDYCNDSNLTIRSLAFDGLMLDENDILNEEFIVDLSNYIFKETGIRVSLAFKSLLTTWDFQIKTVVDEPITNTKFSKRHSKALLKAIYSVDKETGITTTDLNARDDFMRYMNTHICLFDNPHTYGFRFMTGNDYQFRTSAIVKERIGTGQFLEWNDNDEQKIYDKMDFIIDINNEGNPNIYNLYKRPIYDKEVTDDLETRMPLTYEYLTTVVTGGDDYLYRFTLDWLSVMLRFGKTKVCLVFMGKKGAGKSFFGEDLVAKLLEDVNHFRVIKDIKKIKDGFNAREQFNICSLIEEVSESGADFHSTQNVLKSLITEMTTDIRKLFMDAFPCKSNSNYIISTNYNNPVAMTKDNRRFQPYKFAENHLNDIVFFEQLSQEITNNIEYLRGFLINRVIGDRRLHIQDSPLIRDMVELNTKTYELFIRNEMDYHCNTYTEGVHIPKEFIYSEYRMYHMSNGDNSKILPWSRFKTYIMEQSEHYTVMTATINSRRVDVVVKR